MGDRQRTQVLEEMASTSTAVATVSPQIQEEPLVAVITLRAAQPQTQTQQRKKVVWAEDTVDNEHMNKKKSKCCCVYEKPHKFGESDSEDSDDECEHCAGHVEKRKAKKGAHAHDATDCSQADATLTIQEASPPQEATTVLTLQPAEPAPAPPDKDPNMAQSV